MGRGGGTYQAEADGAGEAEILRVRAHLRVGEEEGHGDQRADDHGASPAPEEATLTHEACEDGAGDGAQIRDGVVAPLFAG